MANNETYSSLVYYVQNNGQFSLVTTIVNIGNSPNLYKALKHLKHQQNSVKIHQKKYITVSSLTHHLVADHEEKDLLRMCER